MNKSERDQFDRKVLAYIRAKGTVCPNEIAHHFKKKWETSYNSLRRLTENGLIFYHPEISRSPMCFSIWRDYGDKSNQRYFEPTQIAENGKLTGNSTSTTFDFSTSEGGYVRGTPVQTIEREGFVYHPSVKGKDIPRTFVRGHLHGQYFVDIKRVGKMPETFMIPDTGITGGWMARTMKGNDCFYGHIKFPEDRMDFKFHAMGDKKGDLKGLSVYVHPRYIYYKNNERTAAMEFRQQVRDVLSVLEYFGWEFGSIYAKGVYSMAVNDPVLASNVPVSHVESSTDSVIYDSSPMTSEGGCTEAEILADHPTAEAEVEVMVELPKRIWSIESKIATLSKNMDGVVNLLGTTVPHMENLTKTVHDLAIVTEFNSQAIFGTADPLAKGDTPYIAKADSKGDAMYG